MTDEPLSLAWSRSQASARQSAFRRMLIASLVFHGALAALALFCPQALADLLGLPGPTAAGAFRVWGGLLLVLTLFQIPATRDAFRYRWLAAAGIAQLAAMVIVYALAGGRFWWLAVADLVFALMLARSYLAYCKAELMSRP